MTLEICPLDEFLLAPGVPSQRGFVWNANVGLTAPDAESQICATTYHLREPPLRTVLVLKSETVHLINSPKGRDIFNRPKSTSPNKNVVEVQLVRGLPALQNSLLPDTPCQFANPICDRSHDPVPASILRLSCSGFQFDATVMKAEGALTLGRSFTAANFSLG